MPRFSGVPAVRRGDLIEHFLHVLTEQQRLRPQRQGWTGGELEWITAERDAMCAAVAEQRPDLPREVVEAEVRGAESLADGHSDYTAKFAMGCARIVLTHPATRISSTVCEAEAAG